MVRDGLRPPHHEGFLWPSSRGARAARASRRTRGAASSRQRIGAELIAWVGVFVRSGTPSDIVAKLGQVVLGFVNNKDTAAYLESVGAKPFPAGPDELGKFEEADTRRWAEIVDIAKIEKK